MSFTLPSATISGQPLDGTLKYSIFRGDGETAVKTGRGAAGEYVSYTDNDCGEGTVSYSVTVESAGNTSERVTASTYVGKETPNPVTDLAVSAMMTRTRSRGRLPQPVCMVRFSTRRHSPIALRVL